MDHRLFSRKRTRSSERLGKLAGKSKICSIDSSYKLFVETKMQVYAQQSFAVLHWDAFILQGE